MTVRNLDDLIIWNKARKFTLDIYKITQEFPDTERFGLISQVRRSSISICANIAEGYKKSRKDCLRFFSIARGSLEETKCYLILSRDLNFINSNQYEDLFKKSDEIGKILYRMSINM